MFISDIFCLWYILSVIPFVCDMMCMWYFLSVIPFVCDIMCLWYILSMIPFVCDIMCLWYILSVIPFVCDMMCLWYICGCDPNNLCQNKFKGYICNMWYSLSVMNNLWSVLYVKYTSFFFKFVMCFVWPFYMCNILSVITLIHSMIN